MIKRKKLNIDTKTLQKIITIYQLSYSKWWGLINGNDALIVEYVTRLYFSKHSQVENKKINNMPWVCLKTMLKSLPILNIGYRQLQNRIDHLVNIGLLEREIFIDGFKGNKMVHLKPNEDYIKSLIKVKKRLRDKRKHNNNE